MLSVPQDVAVGPRGPVFQANPPVLRDYRASAYCHRLPPTATNTQLEQHRKTSDALRPQQGDPSGIS
jgi:hypothetical protein